jgi:hypothetical protein
MSDSFTCNFGESVINHTSLSTLLQMQKSNLVELDSGLFKKESRELKCVDFFYVAKEKIFIITVF